ncbi:hypothetical protein VNO78_11656 [Psophocarpus tetragonolobus]|uniref:Uncharacterized protein n=1 Tax=Psophocarpus tetragonolobus TaxID=3891 RepID=A0AAN9XNE8_PSOTE
MQDSKGDCGHFGSECSSCNAREDDMEFYMEEGGMGIEWALVRFWNMVASGVKNQCHKVQAQQLRLEKTLVESLRRRWTSSATVCLF